MKRIFDILFSLFLMSLLSPILFIVVLAIFFQDLHSPFYLGERVGKNDRPFKMVKLRSMYINADYNKIDSTSVHDPRITFIGHLIRRFKFDELMQFWNVLIGDMSIVGPRPNVMREVTIYTEEERVLISVKPGITDLASIVFSDEGDILSAYQDSDLAYNQLIRPWKSRLGLFGIQHQSFTLDMQIIFITALGLLSRKHALNLLSKLLRNLDADLDLCNIATREALLVPTPPPGATEVVMNREKPPI